MVKTPRNANVGIAHCFQLGGGGGGGVGVTEGGQSLCCVTHPFHVADSRV